MIYNEQQFKIAKQQQLERKQQDYAESGYNTAVVNDVIVTIGDFDSDYDSWKSFVVSQMVSMGISAFLNLTGWDPKDLVESLSDADAMNDTWIDVTIDHFNGLPANY